MAKKHYKHCEKIEADGGDGGGYGGGGKGPYGGGDPYAGNYGMHAYPSFGKGMKGGKGGGMWVQVPDYGMDPYGMKGMWGGAFAQDYGKGKSKDKGKGKDDSGKGKSKGKSKSKGPDLTEFETNQKVWVGNLPQGVTVDAVMQHFALTGGTVLAAAIKKGGTGGVAYESPEDAAQAIAVLNMSDMDGVAIQVDVWSE